MKYKYKSVGITKVCIGPNGVANSLCDRCKSNDCSNDIEIRNISILGVSRKMKVAVTRFSVGIVVDCEGFLE